MNTRIGWRGGKVKAEAPDGMARRVLRGGSWNDPTENCRASYRNWRPPDARLHNLGLRLVLGPIQFPEP